jgi:hypothetical protein
LSFKKTGRFPAVGIVVNFCIGSALSGHLLGCLLGPWFKTMNPRIVRLDDACKEALSSKVFVLFKLTLLGAGVLSEKGFECILFMQRLLPEL